MIHYIVGENVLFSVYPVFSEVSQYGHYQYTLAEARQACSNKGAKLATYKQMQAAWEKGIPSVYQKCRSQLRALQSLILHLLLCQAYGTI